MSSASPQSRSFIVFFLSFEFLRALSGFVVVNMATTDNGDSNLPAVSGNELCDIINCVAIYYEKGANGNAFLRPEREVPSTSFKETKVAQRKL